MHSNGEGSKESERCRELPALAEEKEVSPKSPRCRLCGHKQRLVSPKAGYSLQCTCEHGIGGKEGYVGDFHLFVINRRRVVP
jgi:hypothetical protein